MGCVWVVDFFAGAERCGTSGLAEREAGGEEKEGKGKGGGFGGGGLGLFLDPRFATGWRARVGLRERS